MNKHGWDEGGLTEADNAYLDAKHNREKDERIAELEAKLDAVEKRLRQAMNDGEIATDTYYELRKALGEAK